MTKFDIQLKKNFAKSKFYKIGPETFKITEYIDIETDILSNYEWRLSL